MVVENSRAGENRFLRAECRDQLLPGELRDSVGVRGIGRTILILGAADGIAINLAGSRKKKSRRRRPSGNPSQKSENGRGRHFQDRRLKFLAVGQLAGTGQMVDFIGPEFLQQGDDCPSVIAVERPDGSGGKCRATGAQNVPSRGFELPGQEPAILPGDSRDQCALLVTHRRGGSSRLPRSGS